MKNFIVPIIIYLVAGIHIQTIEASEAQLAKQRNDELWLSTSDTRQLHAPDGHICHIKNDSKNSFNAQITITNLDGEKNIYTIPTTFESTTVKKFLFSYGTMLRIYPLSQTVQLSFIRHDGKESLEYDIYNDRTFVVTDTPEKFYRDSTVVKFPQK